jgi:hypothetical protein
MEVAVAKEVTSGEVISWLLAALGVARGDTSGDSGRRLTVAFDVSPGKLTVEVVTWNQWERPPGGRWEYARRTSDGVLVVWVTDPLGIPAGSEWLPEAFVSWIMGGGSPEGVLI